MSVPGARPMGLAKTRLKTKTQFLVDAAVAWSEAASRRYPDEPARLAELMTAAHDLRRIMRGAA